MITLPITARGIIPAAKTIPTAIDQNRNAISRGSLIAVRKRTIDKAPTIPSDRTTLEVTAKITTVVIMVSAIRVVPKLEEYRKNAVFQCSVQVSPEGAYQTADPI